MRYIDKNGRIIEEEDLLEEALSLTTEEETKYMSDDEIIEYWMAKYEVKEYEGEVEDFDDEDLFWHYVGNVWRSQVKKVEEEKANDIK